MVRKESLVTQIVKPSLTLRLQTKVTIAVGGGGCSSKTGSMWLYGLCSVCDRLCGLCSLCDRLCGSGCPETLVSM